MNKSPNYYEILGIPKNSDIDTIKKAYKKLAIQYHPDKNVNNKEKAEEEFKKINEAYSVLSDSDKRYKYDNFGKSIPSHFSRNNAYQIFKQFFKTGPSMFNIKINQTDYGNNINFTTKTFTKNTSTHISYINSKKQDIESPCQIKNNTEIMITKLISKPEINNKLGNIINYNINKDRYLVQIYNYTQPIFLKRCNIQQIIPVTIYNVDKFPELIDRKGKFIYYDYKTNTCRVKLNDKIYGLSKNNIIIESNTCIELCDIKNDKTLNKQYGTIQNFDKKTNRYLIQLKDRLVKVLPKNIRI